MKDYKLSEIKKICEEHSTDYRRLCGECPLGNGVCEEIENAPATWEIDEKDGGGGRMIGYEDFIGYKSPIEEIISKVQIKHDETILKAVQNVGIKVDKNELEKALKYDRDQYDHGYNKGLFDGYEKGKNETAREFAEKLKERCHNYYPSIDHYCCSEKAVNVKDIDELLKEYEK